MIQHARLAYRLHEQFVTARWYREAAQIERRVSGLEISAQGHQVLAIGTDIGDVVIECAVSVHLPLQRVSRYRTGERQTVVDAGLDLRSLFVIVPGNKLQVGQLLARVIKTIDLAKCLKPGLAALLAHNAVASPGGQSVVKSFVGCTERVLARERHAGVVEAGEIAQSVIAEQRLNPRVAAAAERVAETAVVLKDEYRLRAQRSIHTVPVDRIGTGHAEVGDHGLAADRHIRR